MAGAMGSTSSSSRMRALNRALESGALSQVSRMLNHTLSSAELGHLLESSPPHTRKVLWELLEKKKQSTILPFLGDDLIADVLRDMSAEEVADVTSDEDIDIDDVVDILQILPERVTQDVLNAMDDQNRQRIEAILSFPEDTAGGLMNTDTVTIRPDITLDVVLRYLRRHESIPATTDTLVVVNRKDELIGLLPISKLLVTDPSITVREIMETDFPRITADTPDDHVAQLFEREDLVSAPVVDKEGRLLGRITIDDVVDVIREDADHSLMSMAGLDEDDDIFAPVLKTSRRRAIWLGINLLTAFIASAVIGIFEQTLDKVVALAILMPIVASMGGIAGSQTLTLVIRGIATGHIRQNNLRWLLSREVLVGLLNGLLWGLAVAVAAALWFSDPKIGIIIGTALIINLVVAVFSGSMLPSLLKSINIDPALAGSVLLTTITDVVGYFVFLGLATAFYSFA
ncbi:magnesium transporter [Litoribrevibacter albus]|uniref:Magnesium transporter MgtE n=1 Tax=Litoribrevibacter albus TaxID=1473156 RepID=A0AA37S8Y1_9GAMM|nr:magnesium transporter [Litoribrevibacter albus]GLQ31305.1 magnesium transporter MgtE [Litoribrevibacter albus]